MFCIQLLVLLLLKSVCVSPENIVVSGKDMTEKKNPELLPVGSEAETIKCIVQQCTEELTTMRNELQSVRFEHSEMKEVIAELQKNMIHLQHRDADHMKLLEQNSREITILKTRYENISSPEVIQTGSGNNADQHDLQYRFLMSRPTYDANRPTYDATRQKLAGSEFYARLGQKFEVQENEQTIIYDITVTNGGLTYNNKSGIFTCTTSGVYVFSWSALVTADHYVETILRSNKADLGLTYSGSKGYPGSGSQTVVVSLHQGDNVQVKVGSFTPGSVLYDIYTSFTGFRLQ